MTIFGLYGITKEQVHFKQWEGRYGVHVATESHDGAALVFPQGTPEIGQPCRMELTIDTCMRPGTTRRADRRHVIRVYPLSSDKPDWQPITIESEPCRRNRQVGPLQWLCWGNHAQNVFDEQADYSDRTRLLGGNAPSGPWTRETVESLRAIESGLDTPLTPEQVLRADEWSLNALESDREAIAEAVAAAEAGEQVWSTRDQDGYYYCVGAETADDASAAAIFRRCEQD